MSTWTLSSSELFTADVVYDLTDFAQEPLSAVAAIREAAWALGAANHVAHHVSLIHPGQGPPPHPPDGHALP
ncbi:hypothetical protein [Streptomyces sp. NPDC001205]